MYFFVDTADQSVKAFPRLGDAARHSLRVLGRELQPGADPVAAAEAALDDRGALLNLSTAFESVAESDDGAAQELAASFRQAVDAFYERGA